MWMMLRPASSFAGACQQSHHVKGLDMAGQRGASGQDLRQ
jgi:hypothetical protein